MGFEDRVFGLLCLVPSVVFGLMGDVVASIGLKMGRSRG